ncbi:MAG: maleylacetoacetate isomerase [Gammaproteobacteria bacterium]
MVVLYTYFRSSAAYRVRIALNLKGIAYEPRFVRLARGEQHEAAYRAQNPQGLVPTLVDGNRVLTQSLAILEYLDEVFPTPPLLPPAPELRARARAIAGLVACDIHPLNNLRVLRFLEQDLGQGPEARGRWYRHWIQEGFRALETMLGETMLRGDAGAGAYCLGQGPTIADVCLIPQVYNARRFGCDLGDFAHIRAIEARCLMLPAFGQAAPEAQADAE